MSFFGSFSARARRTIFLAHSQALKEGTPEITPEHILSALLKEDPELFDLVAPQHTNSANELQHLLAADGKTQTTEKLTIEKLVGKTTSLSARSKEVVFVASEERKRLGHKSVGTQHLLLALLVTPRKRSSWFRRSEQQQDSVAKQLLVKLGLNAASIEEKIREGIVTPLTWILDDSIFKLNAQLTAMAELLITKGVFKRTEFVAMLDKNADVVEPETFLVPLIDALCEKGKLTAAEKKAVKSIGSAPSSQKQQTAELSEPTVQPGDPPAELPHE